MTGFTPADAIASLVVVALMAKAGYGLVKESWKILLEAAPQGLNPDRIGAELADRPGVREVHDLVDVGRDCHEVRVEVQEHLLLAHDISHVTLQADHALPDTSDAR